MDPVSIFIFFAKCIFKGKIKLKNNNLKNTFLIGKSDKIRPARKQVTTGVKIIKSFFKVIRYQQFLRILI